ncbi:MAG: hypothetical protein FP825_08865 [Hyphomonas sp.]|uniref:hypothetical protein n=1 Tax=Hyphomonas sp. TaxID=87 RepID=UPI0017F306EA|nr:hypothetical protein [Hyphomonas sp.]MBA3068578.1 hypothetical protein [Hyphomonas sp.]MBU4061897.1 hypothetical protein [Alphaproteobacteria bacterium]MBU4166052.1 hypothetical protein [Alphaproteobacteria bacterium]MBU4569649.1 hypothetical protein [Alphaproteobacteria bacterium]
MGRTLRAVIATLLMVEIAAIFFGTSTWAILTELHASLPVILGGEAVAGLAVLVIAVIVFRRALAAERRIDEGVSSST